MEKCLSTLVVLLFGGLAIADQKPPQWEVDKIAAATAVYVDQMETLKSILQANECSLTVDKKTHPLRSQDILRDGVIGDETGRHFSSVPFAADVKKYAYRVRAFKQAEGKPILEVLTADAFEVKDAGGLRSYDFVTLQVTLHSPAPYHMKKRFTKTVGHKRSFTLDCIPKSGSIVKTENEPVDAIIRTVKARVTNISALRDFVLANKCEVTVGKDHYQIHPHMIRKSGVVVSYQVAMTYTGPVYLEQVPLPKFQSYRYAFHLEFTKGDEKSGDTLKFTTYGRDPKKPTAYEIDTASATVKGKAEKVSLNLGSSNFSLFCQPN